MKTFATILVFAVVLVLILGLIGEPVLAPIRQLLSLGESAKDAALIIALALGAPPLLAGIAVGTSTSSSIK